MLGLVDEGRGVFVLGNHDRKLGRALSGQGVRMDAALHATLAQLDPALRRRALHRIERTPAWLARYSASMTASSTIELTLILTCAGRPAAWCSTSRSIRATSPRRTLRGATSRRE